MLKLCSKCRARTGLSCEEARPEECMICSGLLWRIDEIAEKIAEKLREYEFRTFSVGSRIRGSLKALERYLGVDGKSVKYQFNRELAKAIARETGAKPVKNNAEITVIYDLEELKFEINVSPLYVYGRYKKRVRGSPRQDGFAERVEGEDASYADGLEGNTLRLSRR